MSNNNTNSSTKVECLPCLEPRSFQLTNGNLRLTVANNTIQLFRQSCAKDYKGRVIKEWKAADVEETQTVQKQLSAKSPSTRIEPIQGSAGLYKLVSTPTTTTTGGAKEEVVWVVKNSTLTPLSIVYEEKKDDGNRNKVPGSVAVLYAITAVAAVTHPHVVLAVASAVVVLVGALAVLAANNTSKAWKLEFCSGELVYLHNILADKRLRCECDGLLFDGEVSLTSEWYGWDVWRIIETCEGDGSVYIGSWTHPYYLCSDAKGQVIRSSNKYADRWLVRTEQVYTSNSMVQQGVILRSVVHGRILSIDESGKPCTILPHQQTAQQHCGLWALEPAHRHVFSLAWQQGANQSNGSSLLMTASNSQKRRQSNIWAIAVHGDSAVTIHSLVDGAYLAPAAATATSGDAAIVLQKEYFAWHIEERPSGGGYFLRLQKDGAYLWWDEQSNLSLRSSSKVVVEGLDQNSSDGGGWILEPFLPPTQTSDERKTKCVIAAGAVGTAVLAPCFFTSAVGAIGFGTGGIESYSFAAWWMSTAATASGGGVAANSAVAILQSIGTAGLGLMGTAVAMMAGAVGGTVVGAVTMRQGPTAPSRNGASNNNTTTSTNKNDIIIAIPNQSQERPYANWRNWDKGEKLRK